MRDKKGKFVKRHKGFWLGKIQPEELVLKRVSKIKGKKRTEEQKLAYSKSRKEYLKKHPGLLQEKNNPYWKGENVKYCALHEWVRRYKKSDGLCEICKKARKLDVANISGGYKRDLEDYRLLCRSCHIRFDRSKKNNGDDKYAFMVF